MIHYFVSGPKKIYSTQPGSQAVLSATLGKRPLSDPQADLACRRIEQQQPRAFRQLGAAAGRQSGEHPMNS